VLYAVVRLAVMSGGAVSRGYQHPVRAVLKQTAVDYASNLLL
jgi:hypothetical protein